MHLFSVEKVRESCYNFFPMRHISSHIKRVLARTRKTERGELMKFFCTELNRSRRADGLPDITMARMGKILEKIPTKDLYYLKRVCSEAKDFSKKFWWLLNPEKHAHGTAQKQTKS